MTFISQHQVTVPIFCFRWCASVCLCSTKVSFFLVAVRSCSFCFSAEHRTYKRFQMMNFPMHNAVIMRCPTGWTWIHVQQEGHRKKGAGSNRNHNHNRVTSDSKTMELCAKVTKRIIFFLRSGQTPITSHVVNRFWGEIKPCERSEEKKDRLHDSIAFSKLVADGGAVKQLYKKSRRREC